METKAMTTIIITTKDMVVTTITKVTDKDMGVMTTITIITRAGAIIIKDMEAAMVIVVMEIIVTEVRDVETTEEMIIVDSDMW